VTFLWLLELIMAVVSAYIDDPEFTTVTMHTHRLLSCLLMQPSYDQFEPDGFMEPSLSHKQYSQEVW
jgi:hypothetical protein